MISPALLRHDLPVSGPVADTVVRARADVVDILDGRDDTLITPDGGEATAAAIPGADLLVLADMGHDLPEPLWPKIVNAIAGHITTSVGVGASV